MHGNEEKRTDRFIDEAKDFINFPNLGLVVQIYWGVEEVHFFIHLFTLEVEPQRTAMARVVGDLGLFGYK